MESISNNSVKVKVFEITSMTDQDTGKPGKNIKLVQVKQQRPQPQMFGPFGGTEEANMIKGIMGQFQSMGILEDIDDCQSRMISCKVRHLHFADPSYIV